MFTEHAIAIAIVNFAKLQSPTILELMLFGINKGVRIPEVWISEDLL